LKVVDMLDAAAKQLSNLINTQDWAYARSIRVFFGVRHNVPFPCKGQESFNIEVYLLETPAPEISEKQLDVSAWF
jgi:hypothetical protein